MSDCTLPDVYNQIERKARKDHVCSDCRGTIKAGERYRYISGIWDGEPEDYKQCQDCIHMRCEMGMHMDDDDGCGGIPLGGMAYALAEFETSRYGHLKAAFNAYAEARGSKMRFKIYNEDAP